MASANINIRTDSELKSKAQAILDDLGLDMSTAINIFLKQVVYREAIPFEISKDNAKIDKNEKNEKELEEIRQRRLAALGSMKGDIGISKEKAETEHAKAWREFFEASNSSDENVPKFDE